MMFLSKNENNKFIVFVFLLTSLILIDQGTKQLASDIFLNEKFAFSLSVPTWLMVVVYTVILGWLIYFLKNNFNKILWAERLGFSLILAGAISNVLERLIFGHVRDFIYIHLFNLTGIYNLADFYIILGIIILLCYGLTTNNKKLE